MYLKYTNIRRTGNIKINDKYNQSITWPQIPQTRMGLGIEPGIIWLELYQLTTKPDE
jgi:hypothetical protein